MVREWRCEGGVFLWTGYDFQGIKECLMLFMMRRSWNPVTLEAGRVGAVSICL